MKKVLLFAVLLVMLSAAVSGADLLVNLGDSTTGTPGYGVFGNNGYSQHVRIRLTNTSNVVNVTFYIATKLTNGVPFVVGITGSTNGRPNGTLLSNNVSFGTGLANGYYNASLQATLSPGLYFISFIPTTSTTDFYRLQEGTGGTTEPWQCNGGAANNWGCPADAWQNYTQYFTSTNLKVYGTVVASQATIQFVSPTPATGTYQHVTDKNYFIVKSNTTGATIGNITNYLYNSSNELKGAQLSPGVVDATTNFTNLTSGLYYYNATLTINGVVNASTEKRNITFYDASVTVSSPATGLNVNDTVTIQYSSSFTSSGVSMSSYRVDLLNSGGSFNRTLTTTASTSYAWDLFAANISLGTYRINVTGTDSQGYNHSGVSGLFNVVSDAFLNVTLVDALNSSVLANATINITDLNSSTKITYTTTTGKIKAFIVKGRNYTIDVDAAGYALTQANYSANMSQAQFLNVSVYTQNSVYVNVFDEANGLRITGTNISIVFTGAVEQTFSTVSGLLYADSLSDGAYTVKLSGGNYTLKTYSVTVNNRSTQVLNAYLNSNILTTIFQTLDQDTGENIYDASFLMERLINTSYVVVDSKSTDITGRVQVSYLQNVKYRFTIAKTGYVSQVFYLDPIIFSTYTVRLDSVGGGSTGQDFNDVSVVYYPRTFWNGRTNNFTWSISSPAGVLINYTLNISYPGGSQARTGVNAIGQTYNLNFTLGNVSFYSKVNLTYSYTSTVGGTKQFSASYEIIGANVSSNSSIANIKQKDYGLGWFEKVFITTLVAIVLAGFVYSMAGLGGAMFTALIVYGIAAFLGFMPWWSVLITILVGLAIITADAKSGGA